MLKIDHLLNALKIRGYTLTLRRESTCLYCRELGKWIMPCSFYVDESYYIEDNSNPDADRLLYAISSSLGIKGFLLESCNVYADNISREMAQKLKFKKSGFHNNILTNAGMMMKAIRKVNEAFLF